MVICYMEDTVDSFVNDVKLYSNGLVNALENNHFSEAYDYVKNMEERFKTIKEYLDMKKGIDP